MICVALADLTFREILNILKQEEMAEIRIDLLDLSLDQIKQIFQSHTRLIATCRPGRYSDNERQTLLELAIKNGAAYIDVENDAPPEFRRALIQLAHIHHTQIIISYHNFDLTPSFEILKSILKDCELRAADIVKIVTYCQTDDDAERLLSLYSIADKPLIAFGMGPAGRKSRLDAQKLGAPFIYAASEKGAPTAPGQMTKAEILDISKQESKND